MYIANLGRSRAILCRTDGITELTQPHSQESIDEHIRVKEALGLNENFKLPDGFPVTRSIGDIELRIFKEQKYKRVFCGEILSSVLIKSKN